ncbi:MAG TPA: heptaprenyl diphosphate synthase component 1 [Bacilli bacterium]|nr:heptaprenyl diphosphate synthase component 1 [Bacilli bacterium]
MQVQQQADLDLRVEDIRSKIYREMEHRYLTDFLPSPELEIAQLVMAEAMMRAAGLSARDTETVVSSLLLIYHGLAVHEEIEELAKQPNERYRQLGVLAGVYYSSKYYRLLAEVGHVALMGRFAAAIQVINETKAELAKNPAQFNIGSGRYLLMQERIHGALLQAIREVFLPQDPLWEDVITGLVRAVVLQQELERSGGHAWTRKLDNVLLFGQANGEERRYLKGMPLEKRSDQRLVSLHVKYGTSAEIFRQVEGAVAVVEPLLLMLPGVQIELQELCDRLTAVQPAPRRAVEEG